ncbi:MAG: hypothetical protein M0Q92_14780 [Methanoregula sp.]|jgi:hypothetical protein|nr:hypothetical protein [Methanoregula sp.]
MERKNHGYKKALPSLFLLAALILFALSCGCTQQAAQSTDQKMFKEVTASQPDATHIVITYQGGTNMEKIIELETTITDSSGKSQTKSAGSRLATTPIPIKGTNTISGDFSGKDHVVVIAHMIDGSRTTVLDTTI